MIEYRDDTSFGNSDSDYDAALQALLDNVSKHLAPLRAIDLKDTAGAAAQSFARCVRTLQRCWSGVGVRPFDNDPFGSRAFVTAHEAATQWVAGWLAFASKKSDMQPHCWEDERTILQACERVSVSSEWSEKLSTQIVAEWRSAHEFADRQPRLPANGRTEPSFAASGWSHRLKVDVSQAIVTLNGEPYSVTPDSAAIFSAMLAAYPARIAASKYNGRPGRLYAAWPKALQRIVDNSTKGYRLVEASFDHDSVGRQDPT